MDGSASGIYSFGHWLARHRKALRLSRVELARRVSCATVTLRKIEEDARRPALELAHRLADQLQIAAELRELFVQVARGERPVEALRSALVPDAAFEPDAPRTATPLHTNLPAPLTSLVGREPAIEELSQLVAARRLLTLIGVGGVGKTRLVVELGTALLRRSLAFANGVWMVELAALAQPELVPQAIAQALRLPEEPGRTSIETIESYLAKKQLLLIVDNCEHLLDAVAAVVERLLQRCWGLRVVTTSRERLGVAGELVWQVPPLALPELGDGVALLGAAATRLFVERAEGQLGTPDVLHTSAAAVVAICRDLGGLPLAIELTAPLVQHMTLEEIAAQLRDQMLTLASAFRTAVPRHQTMASALSWSYRLLAPHEQALLRHAAVFAGGWTPVALQAVCTDQPPELVAAGLARLVAKSLALRDPRGRRYWLLEPVRQFAAAELAAHGEAELARRRHARHYWELAQQMHRARDTPQEREWLDRLEPERDNLRTANEWAIAHGERVFCLQMNGWLFALWLYRSAMSEARRWLEAAIAIPRRDESPLLPDELEAEAVALDTAGYAASVSHNNLLQAQQWFERALALRAEGTDEKARARALRGCGWIAMLLGDLAQARRYDDEALAVSRATGNPTEIAWSLFDVGHIMMMQGELTAAQAMTSQAVEHLLATGISFGAYRAMMVLGHIVRQQGDLAQALEHYRAALRLQQQMGYLQPTAEAIEGMAIIAGAQRDPRRAARLFGAAVDIRRTLTMPHWQDQQADYERGVAHARGQLPAAEWQSLWERGAALSLDAAVAEALAGM